MTLLNAEGIPTAVSNRLPDIDRPDVGLVMVSQWIAGSPDRQRAGAEIILSGWQRVPWPADLLAVSCFLSTDGGGVLNYAQWKSADAVTDFMRVHGPTLGRGLDEAVPGLEHTGPVPYKLYRSGVREGAPPPGCIVVVSVAFDGPDEQRQRLWVDAVFDALAGETDPPPGGISGHFHLATDGTRVLNYAEWTTEDAHREALERSGQGTVGSGSLWHRVKTFPGVVSGGFKRYKLLGRLSR
jgi:hypothetical protein